MRRVIVSLIETVLGVHWNSGVTVDVSDVAFVLVVGLVTRAVDLPFSDSVDKVTELSVVGCFPTTDESTPSGLLSPEGVGLQSTNEKADSDAMINSAFDIGTFS